MPAPSCPILQRKHRDRMVNLPVHFEQRLVGRIDVDRNGPGFTYDPDWVALRGSFPISITMPLKADRILVPDIFLPWAANLLPESEQLRTLGQLLGLSRSPPPVPLGIFHALCRFSSASGREITRCLIAHHQADTMQLADWAYGAGPHPTWHRWNIIRHCRKWGNSANRQAEDRQGWPTKTRLGVAQVRRLLPC